MLERMCRKGNPLTLLVGMQTSRATIENSVEIPLKTGNRTAKWPSNPTAGHTHWGNQNWKRHMYPNVHCKLFTIAMTWKQPRCTLADEWIRKHCVYVVHIHNGILLSYLKEHIWISSNEMDETGVYYAEWNKSERIKPIQYINAYMWTLERW